MLLIGTMFRKPSNHDERHYRITVAGLRVVIHRSFFTRPTLMAFAIQDSLKGIKKKGRELDVHRFSRIAVGPASTLQSFSRIAVGPGKAGLLQVKVTAGITSIGTCRASFAALVRNEVAGGVLTCLELSWLHSKLFRVSSDVFGSSRAA